MKKDDKLSLPARILRAAFITFGERGYDKASMDEVAQAAGTTKRTVYAHFTNKETLFRASFGQAVEWFLAELPELDPAGDVAAELTHFTSRFSDLSTWRGPVRLQRVAISEAERLPDLAEMLHERVIRGAEDRIARFLMESPGFGSVEAERALQLARLLLNMTTAPQRFATLMEATKPVHLHPSVSGFDRDEAWIRLAVEFFLGGLFAGQSQAGDGNAR
ncbi:TetR/AcrR family transcriptional regulator [Salipiger marinus]|uniref:TetR/AcrR family transcriptional regulator n=1 Tax=Salipiger marinus TaxID=555512 RepID=UPI001E284289|nr:TetR/AcrR family transcriptional regulator [Salipiger manganoxidans]MCD1617992.1 TetR/AcrR family transcriptional regulator [Salipiger manganoxidans]MEB3418668.1 TetR/AcrR family transcriptional regulator [Salipiger manganoxidans]